MRRKKEYTKNDINLFLALKEQSRQDAERQEARVLRAVVALILLVPALFIAVWGGFVVFLETKTDERIGTLQTYLENKERKDEYNRRVFIQDNKLRLEEYNSACDIYMKDLKRAERISKERIKQVEAQLPSDVKIIGYQFTAQEVQTEPDAGGIAGGIPQTTGQMLMTAQTQNKDAPAAFAKKLAECGLFQDVQYNGFSSSVGEAGKNVYSFTVNFVLW